jgi:hypothetical protein
VRGRTDPRCQRDVTRGSPSTIGGTAVRPRNDSLEGWAEEVGAYAGLRF